MPDQKRVFKSNTLAIIYDESRCQRSGICSKRLPDVFDRRREPWIDPDAGYVNAIARAVRACPSGALSYRRFLDEPKTPNICHLAPGGPLKFTGTLHIKTPDEPHPKTRERARLCRCGHSKNKPYCDDTHEDVEWVDVDSMHEVTSEYVGMRHGVLDIIPQKNGPLVFRGPLTVTNSRGQEVSKTRGKLCRCGQSTNKPFCDGSHEKDGFFTE